MELRRLVSDAAASNDNASLEYLPHGGEMDPEAMEECQGDVVADTEV